MNRRMANHNRIIEFVSSFAIRYSLILMLTRFLATAFRLDPWLIGAAGLLSLLGLANLWGSPALAPLFVKQVVFVVVGMLLVVLLAGFDYRWFRSSSIPALLVWGTGVALLVLTVLFSESVRGAANWIFFGPLSVEPVEIVKAGVLFLLAWHFARAHADLVFPSRVVLSAFIVLVPIALTFLQPDLGSAVILAALWFLMAVLLRMPIRVTIGVLVATAGVAAFVWGSALHDYQRERILSFLSPEQDPLGAAYQSRQAVTAVGSGGFFGRGIAADDLSSRLAFLPESATDFAFASLVEQTGFTGLLAMLTAFGIVLFRIQLVARRATNNFSCAYALGLFVLLGIEAVLNVGMNLGFLPVTGTPLPFVSYGGSHTLVAFALVGFLESVRLHQPAFLLSDRETLSAVSLSENAYAV